MPALLTRRLRFIVHPLGDGRCSWGLDGVTVMTKRELQVEDNLLSAFAITIGGALGVGLPMALVIIWLCS